MYRVRNDAEQASKHGLAYKISLDQKYAAWPKVFGHLTMMSMFDVPFQNKAD